VKTRIGKREKSPKQKPGKTGTLSVKNTKYFSEIFKTAFNFEK